MWVENEPQLGIYYVGKGYNLCDVSSPHFSLAVDMVRAIFEFPGRNMALGVHKDNFEQHFPLSFILQLMNSNFESNIKLREVNSNISIKCSTFGLGLTCSLKTLYLTKILRLCIWQRHWSSHCLGPPCLPKKVSYKTPGCSRCHFCYIFLVLP